MRFMVHTILLAALLAGGSLGVAEGAAPKPIMHLGFDGVETDTVRDSVGGAIGGVLGNSDRASILDDGDDPFYKGVHGRCARFADRDSGAIRLRGVLFDPLAGALSFFYKPLMTKPTITRRYGIFRAIFPEGDIAIDVQLAPSATYDHIKGLRILGAHITVNVLGIEVSAGSPIEAVADLLKPGWRHVVITWQSPPAGKKYGYVRIFLDGKRVGGVRLKKQPTDREVREATVTIGRDARADIQSPRGCVDEIMLFDKPVSVAVARKLALRIQSPTEPPQGVSGSVRRVVAGTQTDPAVPFSLRNIKPLAGAEVWVFKGRLAPIGTATRKHPLLVKIVRSGADGAYRVPLPVGTYTVVVRHKGRFILYDYEVDATTGKTYWKTLQVKAKVWTRHIIVDVSAAVPVG